MVFWFKKIVSPFLFPLPLTFMLFLLGLFFLYRKKQKASSITLTITFLSLLSQSYGFFFWNQGLKKIEKEHPVFHEEQYENFSHIVVFGGGVKQNQKLPLISQLSAGTLVRLVEGVRLKNKYKNALLILSGGKVFNQKSEAELMKDMAIQLGVSADDIIMEDRSKDTKDQARLVKELLGEDSFVFVTSAYHMKRSMALLKKQGLNPVPCPVGHLIRSTQHFHPGNLFPSPLSISRSEKYVRECLGLIWAKLRKQV